MFRYLKIYLYLDFPGGADGKASVYNAGDLGSIPGLERSPGEGNGNPPQYSCLENPIDGHPQAEDGIQMCVGDWSSDVCSSDLTTQTASPGYQAS